MPHKLSAEGDEPPLIPVVIYAAKSTADERGSISSQLAAVTKEIERKGGRVIVAEESDEAASAFTGSRGPGLARAIEAAKRAAEEYGEAELWVFDSDRLARGDGQRARHLGGLFFDLLRANVKLRAVEGDDDLSDPIRAVLRGERNHQDSVTKGGHVRRAKRSQAMRGDYIGHPADGYRMLRQIDERGRVTRRMEFDPDRIEIFRLIFDMALEGGGARSIVHELDRRGYRTQPWKSTLSPRPFDGNRVWQVVQMPVYAGLGVYHEGQPDEEMYEGNWPALITREEFEYLQSLRRRHKKAERGRATENFVLARVATCRECGGPMHCKTGGPRRDGSRARRYACGTRAERPGDCRAVPIDSSLVDRAFIANLTEFLGDVDGWRGRLVADREAEIARMAEEIKRAEVALKKCETTVGAIHRRYESALAAGDDRKAEAIEDAMVEARDERDRANRRLAASVAALESIDDDPSVDPLLDFFSRLREDLSGRVSAASGEITQLNALVRDFFGRVELATVTEGVSVRPVLSAAATERIFRDTRYWSSRHARVTHDVYTENVDCDAEIVTTIEVVQPDAIVATGDEQITPPLREVVRPFSGGTLPARIDSSPRRKPECGHRRRSRQSPRSGYGRCAPAA